MSAKIIGPSLIIEISKDFSATYPGASVGILILENIDNQSSNTGLDDVKKEIILELQKQFPDPQDLKQHPVIQSYSRYYKQFKKTYHVLGQLESVIFESRPLPKSSMIIETAFAAELKNMLLTAIHDLDNIKAPLSIGISTGDEMYTTLRGDEKRLKAGDMMMRDQVGVISSVIYGPDNRTFVKPSTSNVMFVVYAPEGITREEINTHFEDIKHIIRMISPHFTTTLQACYPQD
jgi:DNA/RNA-binding domain of Phe-tRNA-synthetase-like protein